MMATRFYQSGDYDNTIERKLLENETAVIQGTEQVLHLSDAGGSAEPALAETDDDKNTLLRKLLQNQAGVIAGRMSFHFNS